MRFFIAFVFLGGLLCLVNIGIIMFLRRKFHISEAVVTEEIIPEEIKGDLEDELNALRSLIGEGIEEIKRERQQLESYKEELKFLIQQSRQELKKWENIINRMENLKKDTDGVNSVYEGRNINSTFPKGEVKDITDEPQESFLSSPGNAKLRILVEKGLREEEIAQRLNIGIGELRLRMALLEKGKLC